jgi:hypothetical protein
MPTRVVWLQRFQRNPQVDVGGKTKTFASFRKGLLMKKMSSGVVE